MAQPLKRGISAKLSAQWHGDELIGAVSALTGERDGGDAGVAGGFGVRVRQGKCKGGVGARSEE